jgi:DNA-binding SARP family transcriptional activator
MSETKLEIHLLGGFRVSREGRTVSGFESQKVRALLAYLGVHRGRSFSRDQLAGLLWPEELSEAARRNLRQALYNLRHTLQDAAGTDEHLEASHQAVALVRRPELWIDVEDFSAKLARAEAESERDPAPLAAAARLYEGDLLAGFHVDESPEFEEWLMAEQERLRDGALRVLLRLVDHHLETGTYSLGVEYGRRLVKLDPLSETAHRRLMRLHAFAGRRSRAITQYQELVRLLDEELGVEPQEETVAEYRAILAEELPEPAVREKAEPVGPMVPLVGRDVALAHLRETWRAVTAGSGRLTVVTGERGIGKTRLIKTFLHEAAASRAALVLQGRYHELAPPIAYLGVAQALRDALVHEVEVAETLTGRVGPDDLAQLQVLLPALRELRPGLPPAAETVGDRASLFDAVARALVALTRTAPPPGVGRRSRGRDRSGEECDTPPCPVVLFLDDVHAADASSLELLRFLRKRLAGEPVWLLVAANGAGALPFALAGDAATGSGEEIPLGRLDTPSTGRIADALVQHRAAELARILERGDGLPLAITELINLLWDEGRLVELPGGSWRLEDGPVPLEGSTATGRAGASCLEEIVHARILDLPPSTRRLFTLAAVAGPEFDADLLARAEGEHAAVVETGLQVLLERWLARLRLGYWADSRKQRDVTLWSAGPHRGTFEYSHPALREIVHASLSPERRAVLHRRIASVLERREAAVAPRWRSEILAHHHTLARDWEKALPHLTAAAEQAIRLRAPATAARYLARRLEALAELGISSDE